MPEVLREQLAARVLDHQPAHAVLQLLQSQLDGPWLGLHRVEEHVLEGLARLVLVLRLQQVVGAQLDGHVFDFEGQLDLEQHQRKVLLQVHGFADDNRVQLVARAELLFLDEVFVELLVKVVLENAW